MSHKHKLDDLGTLLLIFNSRTCLGGVPDFSAQPLNLGKNQDSEAFLADTTGAIQVGILPTWDRPQNWRSRE
jgi:hypothetical protein